MAFLKTNLVSYWKLDESSGNAADAHGSNTLTNNNSTAYATGIINNGADFELSSSNSLSITDAAQSGLDITGDISFSFWMKLEQLPSTATTTFTVLAKYLTTTGNRSYRVRIQSDNKIYAAYSADGSATTTESHATTALGAPDVAVWRHIVVTMAVASGAIIIYKDGTAQSMTTDTTGVTSIYNGAAPFALGCVNSGGTPAEFFDGVLDEVGVWSRVLTAAEVTSLYNSGSGLAYPLPSNQTLTMGQGSFALTYQTAILTFAYTLLMSAGSFVLTLVPASFSRKALTWANQAKSTAGNWFNTTKS